MEDIDSYEGQGSPFHAFLGAIAVMVPEVTALTLAGQAVLSDAGINAPWQPVAVAATVGTTIFNYYHA